MINRMNKFKFTPLMCVCSRGYLTKGDAGNGPENRLKIVELLIEAWANEEA